MAITSIALRVLVGSLTSGKPFGKNVFVDVLWLVNIKSGASCSYNMAIYNCLQEVTALIEILFRVCNHISSVKNSFQLIKCTFETCIAIIQGGLSTLSQIII